MVLLSPALFALLQPGARLLGVQKIALFGGSVSCFNLGGDFIAVLSKPLFLLVEHLNGLLDEFIGGLVRSALDVLLNEGLRFR